MQNSAPTTRTFAAALLTIGMAGTVGTALAFQHLGGYIPCKLCLEQRLPYYVGAPLMLLALLAAVFRLPVWIVRCLLLVGAALMVWSLYLGVNHAGVEWGWWPGPTDCGAVDAPPSSGNILDQIDQAIPPSCDKAAGRFLGLSFAGWNAVASLGLLAVALRGALKRD
ncbi:MAG: disulfide bond formation protein B [Rhizobiaceae bacterium]